MKKICPNKRQTDRKTDRQTVRQTDRDRKRQKIDHLRRYTVAVMNRLSKTWSWVTWSFVSDGHVSELLNTKTFFNVLVAHKLSLSLSPLSPLSQSLPLCLSLQSPPLLLYLFLAVVSPSRSLCLSLHLSFSIFSSLCFSISLPLHLSLLFSLFFRSLSLSALCLFIHPYLSLYLFSLPLPVCLSLLLLLSSLSIPYQLHFLSGLKMKVPLGSTLEEALYKLS